MPPSYKSVLVGQIVTEETAGNDIEQETLEKIVEGSKRAFTS